MAEQSTTSEGPAPPGHAPATGAARGLAGLSLAALGVVYGDIGTSPLYALRECFAAPHGVAPEPANVLGVLSLVTWSLLLVVVVKYLAFILRADNQGEGGILALLALLTPDDPRRAQRTRRGAAIVLLGLFGASLLYGDGMITPAVSVLSAVEGLGVATHALDRFIVPITVVILVGLFLVQKHGTARVGARFGPVMLLWFATLAATGVPWILRRPAVLAALSPVHAVRFFAHHGVHGFLVLGAVVLAITGAEALYADLGHFGRRPIRAAWFAVVLPALLLNYYGQGALLLEHRAAGRAVANPFFALVPGAWIYPIVALATVAAVIASQALISGAYSLTQQAVLLGYFPRVTIVHTSEQVEGQIYVSEVNWILAVACVLLVIGFRRSTNLAAAYGVAVTGTMAITSVLFYAVARRRWRWSRPRAGLLVAGFLAVDLAFLGANLAKIAHGGWFPLAVAAGVFAVLTTWKRGRAALADFMRSVLLPLPAFLEDLARVDPPRVKGTAVFMTSNPEGAPPVLLHHFKHNQVLHRQVVLLSVATEHVPEVPPDRTLQVRELGHGFWQVRATFGFMQRPDVMDALSRCVAAGLVIRPAETSFYLGRETLLTSGRSGMSPWRKALFAFLSRNALSATAFFGIPPNRVVEMGTQIEL